VSDVHAKAVDYKYLVKSLTKSLFSYFEDYEALSDCEKSQDCSVRVLRGKASMAVFLIVDFLKELGVDKITVGRVDYYNYNIDWEKFKNYIGLPVEIKYKDMK
jgi:hypothetical protein